MGSTRRLVLGLLTCLSAGRQAWARPAEEAAQAASPRVYRSVYRTRGLERPVIVMEPAADAGPVGGMDGAAILLLHGAGGLGSDLPVFLDQGQRLVQGGRRVVMPDYFSGAPDAARSDDVRWWPQAVADAVAWTLALPGVDPNRIGAMGYSRGGYLAGEVAVRQAPIRAVVGVASAGNVRPQDIVRRPSVMLIHATGDPVIPAQRTRRWARILRDHGVPVETATLNVRRHHFRPDEWMGIFETADGFFRRTLTAEV